MGVLRIVMRYEATRSPKLQHILRCVKTSDRMAEPCGIRHKRSGEPNVYLAVINGVLNQKVHGVK
jgi:hypothetical protein